MDTTQSTYTSASDAARRLGVPEAWLKREAQAGRVPHIRAGRRILLDPQAVEAALAERAAQAVGGSNRDV
jgi:excisionase family DNA binding protein